MLYPSILDLLRRVAIFCPPAHTGIRGSGLSVKLDHGKVHEVERGHLNFSQRGRRCAWWIVSMFAVLWSVTSGMQVVT